MDIDVPEITEDRHRAEVRSFTVAMPGALDLTGKTVRDAEGNPVGSVTSYDPATGRAQIVLSEQAAALVRNGVPCSVSAGLRFSTPPGERGPKCP